MRKLLPKKVLLDKLCGGIVRSRGKCENPTCKTPMDILTWAHIIGRSCLRLRWRLDNAFCLCMSCHDHFTNHPIEFEEFTINLIGFEKYEELKQDASYEWSTFEKVDYKKTREYLRSHLDKY